MAPPARSSAQTDTFPGRFARLIPDIEVVPAVEFETDDPTMQGSMTITYRLEDTDGATLLTGVHEHLPPGLSSADDETGWRMSIGKLARLVEVMELRPRIAPSACATWLPD